VLAKADPLNAASLLLAAFLVGYRSTRGVSLLEPDASRFVAAHATPTSGPEENKAPRRPDL
jgi:hypothetical protein